MEQQQRTKWAQLLGSRSFLLSVARRLLLWIQLHSLQHSQQSAPGSFALCRLLLRSKKKGEKKTLGSTPFFLPSFFFSFFFWYTQQGLQSQTMNISVLMDTDGGRGKGDSSDEDGGDAGESRRSLYHFQGQDYLPKVCSHALIISHKHTSMHTHAHTNSRKHILPFSLLSNASKGSGRLSFARFGVFLLIVDFLFFVLFCNSLVPRTRRCFSSWRRS